MAGRNAGAFWNRRGAERPQQDFFDRLRAAAFKALKVPNRG